ncbi:ABC-type phosphate/phosphonate transport system permease subunit [Sphingobacterium sp. JUb56]|nr:ABC-type phosphate/phosphonate transport system permease subunit [Sphingobacterium sp. JUb56]
MKWNDIRVGTIGGTLCSIWASFSLGDLFQTALMAVVGTVVSFVTSRLLGRVRRRKND